MSTHFHFKLINFQSLHHSKIAIIFIDPTDIYRI